MGITAFAVSLITAVLVVRSFPESVYSDSFDLMSSDYDLFMDKTDIQSLCSAFLILIIPHIIQKTKRVFRVLLVELTVYFAGESVFGLVSTMLQLNKDGVVKLLAENVCACCVYIVLTVLFINGNKKERPLPIRNVIDTIPRWIYPAVIVFSLTVYLKDGLFDGGVDSDYANRIFNVLWMLSILGISVCAVYFMYKIFLLSYQQNQILKQMNAQQENYEKMLKSDEQLREFRHDYKNHMMVVTALLNSGRTAEAADYLDKVKVSSGIAGRQFSTGSFIVDAILNNKNSLAEEFGIHLSFDGRIPDQGIENSDLCTVVANLLDNAIESTKRYDGNRYVKIGSNVRNGYLTLSFVNPVNAKVPIKNNRIRTTKSDTRNHGIGLRNVERTAAKYNGQFLLSCDEKEFSADVSLKLDHKEDKES
ncbi:MAG: GHKL domain-containing protein [Clostridia bacterium]|nr:GHKL domain-containing protein [Clostridia bacterium]